MEKALQNIKRLLGEKAALLWRSRLERIQQMPGASRKFKQIATAPHREQLGDYLAEILYALIFTGLGFQLEVEPLGEKGPDFKISRDNKSAFLEVTRLRTTYQGPPLISLSDKEFQNDTFRLSEYGNIKRDIGKACDKIAGKFSQVGDAESIIALWNDEGDLDDLEVEQAPDFLREEYSQSYSIPSGLSFVLYGSDWIRSQDHKQLYCFPSRTPLEPHQENWKRALEQSRIDELIQQALHEGKSTS